MENSENIAAAATEWYFSDSCGFRDISSWVDEDLGGEEVFIFFLSFSSCFTSTYNPLVICPKMRKKDGGDVYFKFLIPIVSPSNR